MTVVHTDTEEKFLHVSSLVGNKTLGVYSICKENTCLNIKNGKFRDLEFFKEMGAKILSYEDFIATI